MRYLFCLWLALLALTASAYAAGLDQDSELHQREPRGLPILDRIEKGDSDAALALSNELLEKEPDKPTSYILRARVYAELNQRDHAIADLKKALELAPSDVHAASDLAVLYAKAGDEESAFKTLEEPMRRRPTSTLLKIAKVDVWISLGKLSLARGAMGEVVLGMNKQNQHRELAERFAQLRYRMAIALLGAGDRYAAIIELSSAVSTNHPRRGEYAIKLAGLYLEDGQLDMARRQYEGLANNTIVKNNPDQIKAVQEGLQNVLTAIAKRNERLEQAEALTRVLIPIVDAYRRNPCDPQKRQAVITAISPIYQGFFKTPSIEMILPLSDKQPENLVEPGDIEDAKNQANRIYQRYNVTGLFNSPRQDDYRKVSGQVLSTYPNPFVLQQLAVLELQAKSYEKAYECALLAEAVHFAETYYQRRENFISPFGSYHNFRHLARFARSCIEPIRQTPVEASLQELLRLIREGQWIEADRLRLDLNERVPSQYKPAFEDLLARLWHDHRPEIEAAYEQAYQQAVEIDHLEEMSRIARYLIKQRVEDRRIAGLMLIHLSMEGEQDEYDRAFRQLMSQDPYNVFVLNTAMQRAIRQGADRDAMLYANAVVQFIEEAGSPLDRQGMLLAAKRVRDEVEAVLQPDLASGIWNAVVDFEKQEHEKQRYRKTYQPVIEAGTMRVIELAPNNPSILALTVRLRFALENYAGCIKAAEQLMSLDPEQIGTAQLYISDAYRFMLPENTLDQEQLRVNYRKAIDALEKARAIGAGDPALGAMSIARMCELIGEFDSSVEQYRIVIDKATAQTQRAFAHYKVALISHEQGTANRQVIVDHLQKSIKGYQDNPPQTFEDRAASYDAIVLHSYLTKQTPADK